MVQLALQLLGKQKYNFFYFHMLLNFNEN